MKRILFVSNNYTPYSGGVVSSLRAVKSGLEERGYRVILVTLDFTGKREEEDGVIRLYCPIRFTHKNMHIALPWKVKKQLQEIIQKISPDVIHVHHPFLLGPAAVAIAQKLSIPTIFTYHTMYEQYAHYVPIPTVLGKPIISSLVKKFCKKVDGIIAPSSTIATSLHYCAKPISIIPSPLRNNFLQTMQCKKISNPIQLLTVSRFVKEKNIESMLDATAQLDVNYQFILAGYGPCYEKLRTYAYDSLHLSEQSVQFVYKPSLEELHSLYQQAHFFLFSSKTDTQGIVLAEAMAYSLPVIALDGPGQRDIINQGNNGFLVESPTHMAQQITTCAQNQELYRILQGNAWCKAQAYRTERIMPQIEAFYEEIRLKTGLIGIDK